MRTAWGHLPDKVLAAVTAHAGPVVAVEDAEGWAGADLAAWLHFDGASAFVKGAKVGSVDTWEPLQREAAVAEHVPGVSPRLLWRVTAEDWDLFGFELIEGAREWAEFRTGSPDIPLASAALTKVGRAAAPPFVPDAWERWGYWCHPDDESLFRGDRLVHGDPAAVNFLVEDDRAWLVEWAWAVRGPAWIDPMLWGCRLVTDGGQDPADAAALVRELPGYATGICRGRLALVRAEAAALSEAAAEEGAHPEVEALAAGACAWAAYWESLVEV